MRPVALTVALAVSLLTGCAGATEQEAIAGNYTLRTINGQDLPFLFTQAVAYTAGSLRINDDNTFSTSLNIATTVGGTTTSDTVLDAGTYTLNGTAITFTYASGVTVSSSVTGNTLTIIQPESLFFLMFVYQK